MKKKVKAKPRRQTRRPVSKQQGPADEFDLVKNPDLPVTYPELPIDEPMSKKSAKSKNGKKSEQNPEKPEKRKPGRPDDYRVEYNAQVEKFALLGATDEEIADFFATSVATLNVWKKKYPEFQESIKRGKLLADANVGTRLYQRALGFEHPDTDIRVIDGKIVTTQIRKYYPPSELAGIYWLNNRRGQNWRQKQDIEHKFKGSKIKVKITKKGTKRSSDGD